MSLLTSRLLRAVTALALGLGAALAAPAISADAKAPPRIVQLGDSYSAGNGTGSYLEQICWRSNENYGSQVATTLGARYVDVACSGGVIKDILNPRELGATFERTATYRVIRHSRNQQAQWRLQAWWNNLCGKAPERDMYYDLTVTNPVVEGSSMTATAQCQLMTRAQIAAVGPSTDLVFLTIGGNDIGFSTIVGACLVARTPVGCGGALAAAEAALPKMATDTKAALAAVERRSWGHADIYLLTYPYLLNTDSYGIPESNPAFDAGAGLRALQVRGNQLQQQVVDELNAGPGRDRFHLVQVAPAWGGDVHGLDPHLVADNSNAWLVPPFAPGREAAEWVHPTLAGWTATAGALRVALKN